jgi:hypothetical protein
MKQHILRTISIALAAMALSACSAPMPKESDDKAYVAYLLQRIETLEQRTERNEYAMVGLNRRVNGLANMVTPPQAPMQAQQPQVFTPAPTNYREVSDGQQRNPNQRSDGQPDGDRSAGSGDQPASRKPASTKAKASQRPAQQRPAE